MILADKIKSITPALIATPPKDDEIINTISATVQFIKMLPAFVEKFDHTSIDECGDINRSNFAEIIAKYSVGRPYFGMTVYNTLESNRIDAFSFKILEKLLPQGILTEEEWMAAQTLFTKISDIRLEHANTKTALFSSSISGDTAFSLYQVAEEIYNTIAEGDIGIFVGNTPQLIRYALEKSHPDNQKFISVSLGVSGHPDSLKYNQPESLLQSTVTEQGHELYKQYITHMGITKNSIQGHDVHFIDLVGGGGGIAYLMKAISEIAFDGKSEEAAKSFKVINLAGHKHSYDMVFPHKDKVVMNCISPSYYSLSNRLDQVSDSGEDRLMPNASSYKWDDEDFMGHLLHKSQHLFENPNPCFEIIFDSIDAAYPRVIGEVEEGNTFI